MGNTCFGGSTPDDITPLQHTPPPEPATPTPSHPHSPHSRHSQRPPPPPPPSSGPEPPPPYFADEDHENAPGTSRLRGVPQSAEERLKKEQNQLAMAKRLGILQHIPTDTYTEGEKRDKECIICMIDFEEGDKTRTLPCMHTYHMSCIDDWLFRSFTCPACMEPVDSALLSSFSSTPTTLSLLSTSPATAGGLPAPHKHTLTLEE